MQMTEKTRRAIEIKDAVLAQIGKTPMTCGQVLKTFKLSATYTNSVLNSLKRYKLIRPIPELRKCGSVIYERISDKTFAEVIAEVMKENAKLKIAKVQEKQIIKNTVIPNARVVSSNDYHSHGNKSKTTAWRGYTTFTF